MDTDIYHYNKLKICGYLLFACSQFNLKWKNPKIRTQMPGLLVGTEAWDSRPISFVVPGTLNPGPYRWDLRPGILIWGESRYPKSGTLEVIPGIQDPCQIGGIQDSEQLYLVETWKQELWSNDPWSSALGRGSE